LSRSGVSSTLHAPQSSGPAIGDKSDKLDRNAVKIAKQVRTDSPSSTADKMGILRDKAAKRAKKPFETVQQAGRDEKIAFPPQWRSLSLLPLSRLGCF